MARHPDRRVLVHDILPKLCSTTSGAPHGHRFARGAASRSLPWGVRDVAVKKNCEKESTNKQLFIYLKIYIYNKTN